MVALSQKVEEEREMYVVSKGMQPSSSNINPTPWLFVVHFEIVQSSFIEVNFQSHVWK